MGKIREKQIEVLDDFLMGTDGNENYVKYVKNPIAAQDAATKSYVDAKLQGLDPKDSVRAATTPAIGDITLSGTQTIDVVSLSVGDRVLVKNQAAPEENGIYIVASSGWSRAEDANAWNELVSAFTFVEEGTVNADTGWVCTVDSGGTLETTAVTWTQFSGAGSYTADGEGIELNGSEFYLEFDGDSMSKSASGMKSATLYTERYIVSQATTSPAVDHDTGGDITYTPAGNCDVEVLVNGIEEEISYGDKTGIFYFSGDGGSTARAKADIVANDSLYFSPSNAGYEIETTDEITLIYSRIN